MSIAPKWTLRTVAGPAWGLQTSNGIRARRLRAVAEISYLPVREIEVGLGASGRILWVDAGTPDAQAEHVGTTAGVVLSARYKVGLGPVALFVGPEAEVLARPVSVDVGGIEVFRMPTVVLGISIEARTGLGF